MLSLRALRSAVGLRQHIFPRVVSTIGRRPRCRGWIPVLQPTPADAGSSDPVGCFHSSSSGSSSNQASTACASAGDIVSTAAGYADLLQPQQVGSFQVTAKELAGKGKVRLDAYLAAQLPDASRAKISASIKAGLITINRAVVSKPSYTVKPGDSIVAALLPPEPCTAIPEDIPLDVVFEDDHLIVVNKAPGMVVHLSPGHTTGTLVNALLAHCGLPACDAIPCGSSGGGGLFAGQAVLGGVQEDGDFDEGEEFEEPAVLTGAGVTPSADSQQTAAPSPSSQGTPADGGSRAGTPSSSSPNSGSTTGIIRPGIVHRLDRGTSGLMVVAKTDRVHAALCQQFKERSVSRIYNSITVGVPSPAAARVATNIVRDPGNRLRMMAVPYGSGRGRTAASNYQTLEVVAGGGAAVVQWKLETGRTHQIRVHAKHVGHPLLGDDMYGPNHAASSRQVVGKRSSLAAAAKAAVEAFGRPALHAKTLGFTHPVTKQRLEFDSEWPADFKQLYNSLREWS